MNTSSRDERASMNQHRKNFYNSVFYLILLLLLSGCDKRVGQVIQTADKVVQTADKAVQTADKAIQSLEKAIQSLDKGIYTLGSESRNWQSVLENTRKELTNDVKSTIREEITDLIDSGVASVGEEGRCNADFVGQRTRHALIVLRNNLAKEVNELANQERVPLKPVETVEPAICKVIPDSVDVSRYDKDTLNELKIIGYDFNATPLKVLLKKRDQTEVDVSDSLSRPSNYRLTLNLSRVNGVQLRPTSNQLILKANDRIISNISIIQPSYNDGLTDSIVDDIYAGRIKLDKAIILNKISWKDGERFCSTVGYDEIARVRKEIEEATNFCVARVRNDINAGNPSTSNAIFQGVISWQNAQTQCKNMLGEEIDRVRQAPGLEASAFCR